MKLSVGRMWGAVIDLWVSFADRRFTTADGHFVRAELPTIVDVLTMFVFNESMVCSKINTSKNKNTMIPLSNGVGTKKSGRYKEEFYVVLWTQAGPLSEGPDYRLNYHREHLNGTLTAFCFFLLDANFGCLRQGDPPTGFGRARRCVFKKEKLARVENNEESGLPFYARTSSTVHLV